MDEKFFRDVDGDPPQPPSFGGTPGEAVPAVDFEDLKAVCKVQLCQNVALGSELFRRLCKLGADVQAVGYRAMFLWIMGHIASEQFAPFMRDGQPNDSVFRAAAKVPAEWMGVGIVREGPPCDVNEFLRLCEG